MKRSPQAPFLGTYPCMRGERVRVYGWLPEQVLCATCKRDIQQQEEKSTQHPEAK